LGISNTRNPPILPHYTSDNASRIPFLFGLWNRRGFAHRNRSTILEGTSLQHLLLEGRLSS